MCGFFFFFFLTLLPTRTLTRFLSLLEMVKQDHSSSGRAQDRNPASQVSYSVKVFLYYVNEIFDKRNLAAYEC